MSDQKTQNDIQTKVSLFLDNSLSKEEKIQFISEMQNNPGISEMVANEKSFRSFIKNNVPRRKASPNLIEGIIRNIDANSQ